ncbi:MAG: hypothetical protein R3F40_18205 [Candidatus Competibacteraceae bacterium]
MTTLLATATSLSEADRKNTFHGFFKIHSLDPFTVEDACACSRMAQRAGSDDLANALCSPMGHARRAVHYLAGGNPLWSARLSHSGILGRSGPAVHEAD